jgi:predicted RNA-binding protein with PUA-like domain
MANWLFKEEPSHYSIADLERDGSTLWNGISNALALKHLRAVQPGDRIWFYHTGKEKAVVGEMRAVKVIGKDSKEVGVEVKFVRRLAQPVTLEQVKKDAALAGWDLARLPRLSVVPVSDAQWQRVEELGSA